jgi:hypothetical protein
VEHHGDDELGVACVFQVHSRGVELLVELREVLEVSLHGGPEDERGHHLAALLQVLAVEEAQHVAAGQAHELERLGGVHVLEG